MDCPLEPREKRRQLSPEEKWHVFVEVTSREISQADAPTRGGGRVHGDQGAQDGEGRRARSVRRGVRVGRRSTRPNSRRTPRSVMQ